MNMHKNASLTPLGRERLVREIAGGMSFGQAGELCGCSARTAAKWWRRFQREGKAGLAGAAAPGPILGAIKHLSGSLICTRAHDRGADRRKDGHFGDDG